MQSLLNPFWYYLAQSVDKINSDCLQSLALLWNLYSDIYASFIKVHSQISCMHFSEIFTKRQKLGEVQIQSICRQQIDINSKFETCFGTGRKHCGKKRKCWLPAFSPFPARFSKGFLPWVVKSRDCLVKG